MLLRSVSVVASKTLSTVLALSMVIPLPLLASLTMHSSAAVAADRPGGGGHGPGGGTPGGGGGHGPGNPPTHPPTNPPTHPPTNPPTTPPTNPPVTPPTNPPVTPPAGPTEAEKKEAANKGRDDGAPQGVREARDRAGTDADQRGAREGQSEGFAACEREERQRAYDGGLEVGSRRGSHDGDEHGTADADRDARVNGRRDGEEIGRTEADREARADATGPGTDQGNSEANSSDATAKGERQGRLDGDADARKEAIDVDRKQGREDYYKERFAADPKVRERFSVRQLSAMMMNFEKVSQSGLKAAADGPRGRDNDGNRGGNGRGDGDHGNTRPPNGGGNHGNAPGSDANPDNRYNRPGKVYDNQELQNIYVSNYSSSYQSEFKSTYREIYSGRYWTAYDSAENRGCEQARRQDYRRDRERGEQEGYTRAYDRAYKHNYDDLYVRLYPEIRDRVKEDTKRDLYQGFYDQYFEAARSAAYQARYSSLFEAARQPARDATYAEKYPVYAKQEYQTGRDLEAADFKARPLRMTGVEVVESRPNGVTEPEEILRAKVQLRNFAAKALPGDQVVVKIEALNAGNAVISESSHRLPRALKADSLNDVEQLFEFRLLPNSVGKVTRFKVSVTYENRDMDAGSMDTTTQYQVNLELSGTPQLSEGMPMPITVESSNQSKATLANGARMNFRTDNALVQVVESSQLLPELSAGSNTITVFQAIARTKEPSVRLPLVFDLRAGDGWLLGALDTSRQVPVVNDYRMELRDTRVNELLHTPGLVRIPYRLKNVSSRLLFRGLQMKISAPDSLLVLGPNPQYLIPLQSGEALDFSVPVMVQNAGGSGIVELSVYEDGRLVVVHQIRF